MTNYRHIPLQRPFQLLACLTGLLLLAGCASMDKQECRLADWRMIGYEDGAAGRPGTRIGAHREACAQHGVIPDMAAYRRGREEGLAEYCRPRRAYELGRDGSAYPGVCPAALEGQLKIAWEDGRRLYEQNRAVRHVEHELAQRHEELEDIRATQAGHAGEIASGFTNNARRLELLAEMRNLVKREVAVEDEIAALEYELEHERVRLADLQSRSGYR